jgi:tyrosyl-tRNA synthetase
MSLPDALMMPYFEYCTPVPLSELRALDTALREGRAHPRDVKKRLAREITAMYHGAEAAREAEREFERVFGGGQLPEDIPEVTLNRKKFRDHAIRLAHLLAEAGLAPSNTEARRLISQGGVSLDGKIIQTDLDIPDVAFKDGLLIRVGRRRFARVRLSE